MFDYFAHGARVEVEDPAGARGVPDGAFCPAAMEVPRSRTEDVRGVRKERAGGQSSLMVGERVRARWE